VLTITYEELKSHVYVYDRQWILRWSSPEAIKQIAVGPYDVYALLENGDLWYVGHTEGDSWQREPVKISSLGSVERLFIDYTHPLAVTTKDEVWAVSILGDGLTPVLKMLKGTDNEVADEEVAPVNASDPLRVEVTRLDRLSGKRVSQIVANQMKAMALTEDGKVLFFMYDRAGETLGGFEPESAENFEMPEGGFFAEVEYYDSQQDDWTYPAGPTAVSGRRAVKIHADGILLDSGEVALLTGAILKSASCQVSCPLSTCGGTKNLSDIVDISTTGQLVALDKYGKLWALKTGYAPCHDSLHTIPTTPIVRMAGAVAVSAGDTETAFALDNAGAVVASAAHIGGISCDYCAQAAWIDVPAGHDAAPESIFLNVAHDLEKTAQTGNEQLKFVNNALAASIGTRSNGDGTEGKGLVVLKQGAQPDAAGVRELLKQGAQPEAVMELLRRYGGEETTPRNFLGLTPEIWSLLTEGNAKQEEMIKHCVDNGDTVLLQLLVELGAVVSEEQKEECKNNKEDDEE